MARATLTRTAIPVTGLNLTDATYATLGTGAGNGGEVAYHAGDLLALKNDTGGDAVYTIKVPAPAKYTAVGATLGDVTVTVATAKTWLYKVDSLFRQADGDIYIDCNVAGKIAVLIAAD